MESCLPEASLQPRIHQMFPEPVLGAALSRALERQRQSKQIKIPVLMGLTLWQREIILCHLQAPSCLSVKPSEETSV